jgi:hypothetical protein
MVCQLRPSMVILGLNKSPRINVRRELVMTRIKKKLRREQRDSICKIAWGGFHVFAKLLAQMCTTYRGLPPRKWPVYIIFRDTIPLIKLGRIYGKFSTGSLQNSWYIPIKKYRTGSILCLLMSFYWVVNYWTFKKFKLYLKFFLHYLMSRMTGIPVCLTLLFFFYIF